MRGDLLDDVVDTVRFGPDVGAVRRDLDGQHAAVRAASVFQHREADRLNEASDLAGSERNPDLAVHAGDRHRDDEGLGDVGVHVEHAIGDVEPGHAFRQELTEAPHRGLYHPRVDAAFETRRCLRAEPEALGRACDGHGREVRRLEQDLRGRRGDSDEAPPMIPPMPTGLPSASQIRQSSPVSPRLRPCSPTFRRTPSSVSTVSPGRGVADGQPTSGQQRQVVGMGRLAQLEHDVVRGVDDVVDRAHAGQQQALGDPTRRGPHDDVTQDGHGEARTGSVASTDVLVAPHRPAARGGRGRLGECEGQFQAARQVAGDPGDAPCIGAVPLDGDVEHGVGRSPSAAMIGVPGWPGSLSPRINRPAASSARPSFLPGHSMPLEATPRSLRWLISKPPGRMAPTGANGTRSPTSKLVAPHTISSGSAPPPSTMVRRILSAPLIGRMSRTRPTTTSPSPSPTCSIASTTSPRSSSASRSAPMSSGNGAKSRSQLSGARTEDFLVVGRGQNCERKRMSFSRKERMSGMA